jgi:peptidoglycan/LPS O-acetylase OafA/YrhL
VALGLGIARSRQSVQSIVRIHRPMLKQWIRRGARSSYALFLTHFSVLLLVNALWDHLGWESTLALGLFTLGAWSSCLVLAVVFERYIERPLSAVRV